ncbi:MAG: 23S rRNA (adenine(2503)-C(2))-methyltransferase RlmN [Oscillospiraceae bacterium]|jgi:23S rRNA (adenine2503-C2)-methyltransferase|nr:23S rRNA (adenine(2503)-C(2))-methyltransferase RlmN [Oscillospiraceae bacterium]
MDGKPNILSLFPGEIGVSPDYRQKQIFAWLGKKGARSFGEMTDLPKALRAELAERYALESPRELTRLVSADGTQKILWELADGERIETALMRYRHGVSVCLSTQAGCRQGCAFCASGGNGLSRSLSAGEMLAQALYCGEEISRAVLMGTGEPLDNFNETVRFLKLISHPDGRNLGLRHISLSTCGDVPGILKLAELGLPVTLSVSLHAPDDETRGRLMPINRRYPISELMDACGKYFAKTARRISYEYVIIEGLNDSPGHARRLALLLRGRPAHVNVIPYNPVPGKPFRRPGADAVRRFARELEGLSATVRRTLGADIDGACGQLRSASRAGREPPP